MSGSNAVCWGRVHGVYEGWRGWVQQQLCVPKCIPLFKTSLLIGIHYTMASVMSESTWWLVGICGDK